MKTRKGDRMAVLTLEDPHGSLEVVVFPEAYAKAVSVIEAGRTVVVRGKVERDEDIVRMLATEVLPIEALRERLAREVSIRLSVPPHGRATFEALATLFSSHRGDRRVAFELELRGRGHPLRVRAGVAAQVRVKPSERLVAEVERICGAGTVVLR
jgi:DNA polymerase-3 subunit alpha